MAKQLDVTRFLADFDGTPCKIQNRPSDPERVLTLKEFLLTYLRQAQDMGFNPQEETIAFDLGCLIATSSGILALEQHQYDLVKRISDNPRIAQGQFPARSFFTLPAMQSAKRLVDAAETVPEPPKT